MILAVGLSDRASQITQLITVFCIFLLVLGITYFTTRWIAGYQKNIQSNSNIEIVDTQKIATGKYLQIIRIGEKYLAIAVCKDTVEMLCELKEEDLNLSLQQSSQGMSFAEILNQWKGTKNSEVHEKNKDS